jgi:multidrug resistance efflux pump
MGSHGYRCDHCFSSISCRICSSAEDAYVRSDFVEVAPEVAGVVDHVEVVNDQEVTVGTPLATIDPKPFDLAVHLSQGRVDQAYSAARVKPRSNAHHRLRDPGGDPSRTHRDRAQRRDRVSQRCSLQPLVPEVGG